MKLTDIDIEIMRRFDWKPFAEEHRQPANRQRQQDRTICEQLTRTRARGQFLAHAAFLEYHAFR